MIESRHRTAAILAFTTLASALCIVSLALLGYTYTQFKTQINVTYFNYYGILIYTLIVAVAGVAIHSYKYYYNIHVHSLAKHRYINWLQILHYAAQGCSIGVLLITLLSQSIFFNTNTHSVLSRQGAAFVAVYVLLDCLLALTQLLCIITATLHAWREKHKIARNIVVICNSMLFIMSMVILLINRVTSTVCFADAASLALQADSVLYLDLMQYASCYVSSIALFGLGLSLLVKGNERLHYSKIVTAYCGFAAAGSITLLVVSILTLNNTIVTSRHQLTVNAIAIANPILASVLVLIFIVAGSAATMVQAPQSSGLCVQEIDLITASAGKIAYYSRLINQYGHSEMDSISGESAVELMKAYQRNGVTGATVRILRIYRANKPAQDVVNTDGKQPDSHPALPAPFKQAHSTQPHLAERGLSYAAGVWSKLDVLQTPVASARTLHSLPAAPPAVEHQFSVPFVSAAQPLSKNAQAKLDKKLKRKAAQKGIDIETYKKQFGSTDNESADSTDVVIEIPDTDCTEAICILTQIEQYDLTSTLSGKIGRLIQRCLGSQSALPLLCVRMGLIGFHWPFKSGIFYCSSTRRPVGRNAAVLRAISEYNQQLPKQQRSTMLLIPYHTKSDLVQSIAPAGYVPSNLPPTHIIDLRAYHNSTLHDYFKAIKYQEQNKLFNAAHGEVELVVEPWNSTVSEQVIQYWSHIADKRAQDGDSPVLFRPTPQFITDLGAMLPQYRSLMFLKIGGEIVATCVMLQFPHTLLTSDLQGLDYVKGKPVKAYFVMMSAVIEYALKHKYAFLEFGPTTPKPKLAIGCRSIALTAAIYNTNPFIHLGSKYFSSSFSEKHIVQPAETTKQPAHAGNAV